MGEQRRYALAPSEVTLDSNVGLFARALRCTLICVVAGTGCLDRRAGRTGDVTPSDVEVGAPDNDVTVSKEVATCDPSTALARTGAVEFDQRDIAYGPVALDGTTLYGTRGGISADGSYLPRNIVAIDVTTQREVVVAPSNEVQSIVDARDGVIIYASTSAEGQTLTLRYRDVASGAERLLLKVQEPASTRPIIGEYGPAGAVRLVERGGAVWGEQVDAPTGRASSRVRAFDGSEIRTLWEGQTSIHVPTLRAGRMLWITYDPPASTLWLASFEGDATSIVKGALEAATLTDDAAWWIDAGVLSRYDFASGVSQRVADGPCGMLVADAKRVAAVCGPPGESAYIARLGTPMVFEGTRAQPFATIASLAPGKPTRVLAGLTLSNARVAWVEYPENVGCIGGSEESGDLVVAGLAAPDRPEVVATVKSGCWCCDAYWAPLQLGLGTATGGDTVAWNYALVQSDLPSRNGAAVGWGLFDTCR